MESYVLLFVQPLDLYAYVSTSIFQKMLVDMILEHQRLVPEIVAFVDRLLGCQKHCWLGERLLQTLDENLLPKVLIDYKLISCFPIFDRIAANNTIPPSGLLELLTKFMVFLVEKHGPDTGLKSWSQGSKVLGVCRTMLMHHHSSRLFLRLSRLLAFTCLYFPDLEVRDNARYDIENRFLPFPSGSQISFTSILLLLSHMQFNKLFFFVKLTFFRKA